MTKNKQTRLCYRYLLKYIIVIILGVSKTLSASDQPKSFLDANTILNTWESNYAHIDSMKVSYIQQTENYKPPASDPNMIGPVGYIRKERIEQGARYHDRANISRTGLKDAEYLVEHSFDGLTTRQYFAAEHSGAIFNGLINVGAEKDNTLKRHMLADLQPLQKTDEYKDMYPNGIPSLSLYLRRGMSNNTITVSPTLELVNGQLCHIIKKTAKEGGDKNYIIIYLAHEKGMLPIKFQRYENGALAEEYDTKEVASTKTDHGIFWYPKQASRFLCYEQVGTVKLKLTVSEFIPNIAVKDSDFKFDFPNGTQVVDKVRGLIYTVGAENK